MFVYIVIIQLFITVSLVHKLTCFDPKTQAIIRSVLDIKMKVFKDPVITNRCNCYRSLLDLAIFVFNMND